MPAYNMHEAKTKLSELVASLEDGTQTEIILARNGKPVARVLPIAKDAARYQLGVAKGKFTIMDDIDGCNDEVADMFGVNG